VGGQGAGKGGRSGGEGEGRSGGEGEGRGGAREAATRADAVTTLSGERGLRALRARVPRASCG